MGQVEPPLWEVLRAAAIAPDEADMRQLFDVLEEALIEVDTVGQLQVAAEAIAQIVQVFQARSVLTFEELEATVSEDGPTMPENAFDRYVRQTMEVDFEQFIEPLESLPRKLPERQTESLEGRSVVGELDQAALLQALDEQMQEHPDWTEMEAFNQALAIAHDEDVASWVEAIAHWMENQQVLMIPLVQLHQTLDMSLVQLWLALLLGSFMVEQRGEFYDIQQVWVVNPAQ